MWLIVPSAGRLPARHRGDRDTALDCAFRRPRRRQPTTLPVAALWWRHHTTPSREPHERSSYQIPLPPLARRPHLAPVTTPFAPIRTPPPAGAVTGGRRVGPPPSPLWSKAARGASRRPRACAGGALSAPSAGGAAERQAGFGPDLAKPAAGAALGSVALATPVRAAGVDRAGRLVRANPNRLHHFVQNPASDDPPRGEGHRTLLHIHREGGGAAYG